MKKIGLIFLTVILLACMLFSNICVYSEDGLRPDRKIITAIDEYKEFLIIENDILYLASVNNDTVEKIAGNILDAKFGADMQIVLLTKDNQVLQYNRRNKEIVTILSDAIEIFTMDGCGFGWPPYRYHALTSDKSLWSWGDSNTPTKLMENVKTVKSLNVGYPQQNHGEFIITNEGDLYEVVQTPSSDGYSLDIKYVFSNVKDVLITFYTGTSIMSSGKMTYYLTNDGELFGEGYYTDRDYGNNITTEYDTSQKIADNVLQIERHYYLDNSNNLYALEFHTTELLLENIPNIDSMINEYEYYYKDSAVINADGNIIDVATNEIIMNNAVKLIDKIGSSDVALTNDGCLYRWEPMSFDSALKAVATSVVDFYVVNDGIIYETEDGSLYVVYTYTNDGDETRKILFPQKINQNITVSEIPEKTYGDDNFTIQVTPDPVSQLSEFTFEIDNTDVAEIAPDGTVTIKSAGEANITIKQAGNVEYAAFEKTQKLVVNKKNIEISSINPDEKTVVIDGILSEDTEVELDFNKLNIEIIDALDENTSNIKISNFIFIGEKSENYVVTTESIDSTMLTNDIVTISIIGSNKDINSTVSYIKGSVITVTATPYSGYRFNGWYVDDVAVATTESYSFTADTNIALTAKYTKISTGGGGGGSSVSTYTIKFETNGGSKVESQKIKRNSTVSEPTKPSKDGYDFIDWFTDKECKNKYDFNTKITKGFTLYALWEKIDDNSNKIILTIGKKDTLVFGKTVTNDVVPLIRNDRTMLPTRFVAESLGANVKWDEATPDIVTITKDDVIIVIFIGEEYAEVNGEKVKLDSVAFIENDRTYTPIRFISEELGAKVEWNENTQKVIIIK